jgi:hypothetical protein
MALFFSAHTTACLTKQELRPIMQSLLAAGEVKVRRAVVSQLGGRMLVEAEAPEQKILEKFFTERRLVWQWIMPIDLDAHDGQVSEL